MGREREGEREEEEEKDKVGRKGSEWVQRSRYLLHPNYCSSAGDKEGEVCASATTPWCRH